MSAAILAMRRARFVALIYLLGALLFLAGCKTIQQPWAWVDEPENQVWMPVTIELLGRTVTFSVPDSDSRMGTNTITALGEGVEEREGRIWVPNSSASAPVSGLAGFFWERYWGGYFRPDVDNYYLVVRVWHHDRAPSLFDLTPAQRKERLVQDHNDGFDDSEYGQWSKSVFNVELHESSQGYIWTNESSPARVKYSEEFKIPITVRHELEFDFYYRMDDDEGKSNTKDWYERRKALSRKILDTVRITPEPKLPSD